MKQDCSHSSKSSQSEASSMTCRKVLGFSPVTTSASLLLLDSPGVAMSVVVAAASFAGT